MDWPYPSYDKIATRLEHWLGDDEAAFRALRSVPWVVKEKIHGANLCLASDGDRVRVGKRKEWLAGDDAFFDHRQVTDPLHEAVLALARALAAEPGTLTFVYGELFGGAYPHPEVPAVPGAEPVQTGVWYAPGLQFLAFDVAVLVPDGPGRFAPKRWLPFEEARAHLEAAGLPQVPALLQGSYTEAIALPLGFDSTIPALLGLPALPSGTNAAEGVVLTPARPVSVRGREHPIRPVLKRKIPAFEEDARYHGAVKPSARRVPSDPTTTSIEGALPALCAEASDLACEPRLNAAISKVGRVTDPRRASEVLALLVTDLKEALAESNPTLLQSLTPAEQLQLHQHLLGEATALIELYCGISPGP